MRKLLGILLLLTLAAGGCVKLGNFGCSPDNSPKIHVFTAVPDAVDRGKQVMLRWEVSNASSVTIEPGIGPVELIGSRQVTVNAPTVFLLTATNRFDKKEKPVSVTVGISGGAAVEKPPVPGEQKLPGLSDALPPTPPMGALDQPSAGPGVGSKPTVIFKATPTAILPGGSSELTWTVIESASVSIDQGIGSVAQSGKKTVSPAATTKYTLVAKNNKGEAKGEATITVVAAPAASNWTGTWQCGQYKMYLTQAGSQVTGWYDNQNGDIEGYAPGSTLVGTWYDAQAGLSDIQLTMSANGNAFTGHYRTGSSGSWISYWSCTRISSAIPPAKPSALGPPPTALAANWTGTWQCGETKLYLTQTGSKITGWNPADTGVFEATATGNVLLGTWTGYDPILTVEYTMAADGNSYVGRYRTGSGNWVGTRSCTRISSDPPPSQLQPSLISNWAGQWLCGQWGRLKLTQSGNTVTGTYSYKGGKFEGYATGNTLVGIWSEEPTYKAPDNAGDVQFNMSADGNAFTGYWRYGSSGTWAGTWNGTKDN